MTNPQYGQQQSVPNGAYPVHAPTNGVAIAALVFSILFAPVGLLLGYVARSQIKRSGHGGWGLTTAALIVGWIQIAPILIVGLWIAFALLYHEVPIFSMLGAHELFYRIGVSEQYVGASLLTLAVVVVGLFLLIRTNRRKS
jgi:hypothetical protein